MQVVEIYDLNLSLQFVAINFTFFLLWVFAFKCCLNFYIEKNSNWKEKKQWHKKRKKCQFCFKNLHVILSSHKILEKCNKQTCWSFELLLCCAQKCLIYSTWIKYKFSLKTQKVQKNLMNRLNGKINCWFWVSKWLIFGQIM